MLSSEFIRPSIHVFSWAAANTTRRRQWKTNAFLSFCWYFECNISYYTMWVCVCKHSCRFISFKNLIIMLPCCLNFVHLHVQPSPCKQMPTFQVPTQEKIFTTNLISICYVRTTEKHTNYVDARFFRQLLSCSKYLSHTVREKKKCNVAAFFFLYPSNIWRRRCWFNEMHANVNFSSARCKKFAASGNEMQYADYACVNRRIHTNNLNEGSQSHGFTYISRA